MDYFLQFIKVNYEAMETASIVGIGVCISVFECRSGHGQRPDFLPVGSGLAGFSTTGAMMAGMQVSATFSGGLSQTLSWSALTSSSGGVKGSGWSLTESGNTYSSAWNFTFASSLGQLTGLVLDASGSSQFTIFDTTLPTTGTSGSSNGRDFVLNGCDSCNALATYSNAVGINDRDPVGDLFHTLSISFSEGAGPSQNFSFLQDTDNDVRLSRTLPEPSSILLLGLALGAVAFVRRRKPNLRARSIDQTELKRGWCIQYRST